MTSSFDPFLTRIEHFSSQHPDSPKPEILLNRLFLHVSKLFNEHQNEHLAPYGLNSTSWSALMMIYSTPEQALNPCELSNAVVSSRTNMTRLSDELVQKGWIERKPSSDDRRRVVLSLTEQGRALIKSVLPGQWEYLSKVWSAFNPDEFAMFNRLLGKLLAHIDAL